MAGTQVGGEAGKQKSEEQKPELRFVETRRLACDCTPQKRYVSWACVRANEVSAREKQRAGLLAFDHEGALH